MTSCGCFECILALVPEANGFMIVNREFPGETPCGMKFSTLAGCVGGGNQTPGFLGVGRLYVLSRKFISGDGGLKRLVWMPQSRPAGRLPSSPNRCPMDTPTFSTQPAPPP